MPLAKPHDVALPSMDGVTVDTAAYGKDGYVAVEIAYPIAISSDAARLPCESMSVFQMETIYAGGFVNQLRLRSGKEFFDA